MKVGSELETAIWVTATRVYGTSLHREFMRALALYRRRPGLDALMRLHGSFVGDRALEMLRQALDDSGLIQPYENYDRFIEIRFAMRWHIVHFLQRRLIEDGRETSMMRDDSLGVDLGL